jgi:hypothetical protein
VKTAAINNPVYLNLAFYAYEARNKHEQTDVYEGGTDAGNSKIISQQYGLREIYGQEIFY